MYRRRRDPQRLPHVRARRSEPPAPSRGCARAVHGGLHEGDGGPARGGGDDGRRHEMGRAGTRPASPKRFYVLHEDADGRPDCAADLPDEGPLAAWAAERGAHGGAGLGDQPAGGGRPLAVPARRRPRDARADGGPATGRSAPPAPPRAAGHARPARGEPAGASARPRGVVVGADLRGGRQGGARGPRCLPTRGRRHDRARDRRGGGRGRLHVGRSPNPRVRRAGDHGPALFGGATWRELWSAGAVQERREGAVATADAMFATTVPPWTPLPF